MHLNSAEHVELAHEQYVPQSKDSIFVAVRRLLHVRMHKRR